MPSCRIDTSNKTHDIRMALRDRMRLRQIVPQLETSRNCFVCKYAVVGQESYVKSPCCDRTLHHSCVAGVSVCPYCNEAWGGLPCAVCGQPTVSSTNREVFHSHLRRKKGRLECCGLDVHPKRRARARGCPQCGGGKLPIKKDYVDFVRERREQRRNEQKRRMWGKYT